MSAVAFWTIATVMVVVATLAVLVPLFWVQSAGPERLARRRWFALIGLTAGVPLAALAIYSQLGSPTLLGAAATAKSSAALPHTENLPTDAAQGSRAGGDMDTAIIHLEAKLAKSPNDSAGWQLLAQSYDFVGRTADAVNARARATEGTAAPVASSLIGAAAAMPGAITSAPKLTANAPDALTVAGAIPASNPLIAAAEKARRERDYPRAVAAFKKLSQVGDMSADLWADYADAMGALRGKLDAASAPMIGRALALDPNHVKALWLLGSLQTQLGDARSALLSWQKLATLIPASSPDAKLIAANIEEARGASGAVSLSGQVLLDARWKAAVTPDTVLFIFAKSVDQPGPPLAVLRTTAASWPVSFVLDDSMAMLPSRRLSDFQKVTVEARVSRSGSANPTAGDLRGATPPLNPAQTHTPLRIVISEQLR